MGPDEKELVRELKQLIAKSEERMDQDDVDQANKYTDLATALVKKISKEQEILSDVVSELMDSENQIESMYGAAFALAHKIDKERAIKKLEELEHSENPKVSLMVIPLLDIYKDK